MLKELEQARRQVNAAVRTSNPDNVVGECISVSASLAMLLSPEGKERWAERFYEAADFLASRATNTPDGTPSGPEPSALKLGVDYATNCLVLHIRGFECPVTLSIQDAMDLIMQLIEKTDDLDRHQVSRHRSPQ